MKLKNIFKSKKTKKIETLEIQNICANVISRAREIEGMIDGIKNFGSLAKRHKASVVEQATYRNRRERLLNVSITLGVANFIIATNKKLDNRFKQLKADVEKVLSQRIEATKAVRGE
jgi:hypothetical protein